LVKQLWLRVLVALTIWIVLVGLMWMIGIIG
jgi:hypothetical protein